MSERIYCVKRPAAWSPFIVGKVYFMKIRQTLGGEVAYIAGEQNETDCLGMQQVVECFILIDRIAKKEIQDQFEEFISFPLHQFIEDLEAVNINFDWYIVNHHSSSNILHLQDKSHYASFETIDITKEKRAQKGTKRYKELLDNALDALHQILH